MFTLGYRFRPWRGEHGARRRRVDPRLRPRHRAASTASTGTSATATASSAPTGTRATARWTVTVERRRRGTRRSPPASCGRAAATTTTTRATRPTSRGSERLRGPGRAPAALARGPRLRRQAGRRDRLRRDRGDAGAGAGRGGAAHVTMLQRSPTYVLSAAGPRRGRRRGCGRLLGRRASYAVTRWKNIAVATALYQLSRARPRDGARLDPQGHVELAAARATTSTPTSSRPTTRGTSGCAWCPTATCSAAIRDGRRRRGHRPIEHLHRDRHRARRRGTSSTPTSSSPRPASTCRSSAAPRSSVDGESRSSPARPMAYRAMMLCGVPNFAFTIGYTNASWTLKADLVAEYVVRLLRPHGRARARGPSCRCATRSVAEVPLMDFEAGYVQRVVDTLPRQGDRRAVGAQAELPPRRPLAAPREARRRGAALVVGERRQASEAIRSSTRRLISSRIGRTASMPCPAGSSSSQSS